MLATLCSWRWLCSACQCVFYAPLEVSCAKHLRVSYVGYAKSGRCTLGVSTHDLQIVPNKEANSKNESGVSKLQRSTKFVTRQTISGQVSSGDASSNNRAGGTKNEPTEKLCDCLFLFLEPVLLLLCISQFVTLSFRLLGFFQPWALLPFSFSSGQQGPNTCKVSLSTTADNCHNFALHFSSRFSLTL